MPLRWNAIQESNHHGAPMVCAPLHARYRRGYRSGLLDGPHEIVLYASPGSLLRPLGDPGRDTITRAGLTLDTVAGGELCERTAS